MKDRGGGGEGTGSRSNNLVYTKKQKDIYANRKHETTLGSQISDPIRNQDHLQHNLFLTIQNPD